MVEYCEICGCELEEDENGTCKDCLASIVNIEEIFPNEEDFL